ncbi:MAG TPA: outer membrane protein assembly factor BamD [Flavobacteriales bacterium]|nr:outer membrane protein assembly factor BamD [Flavobacteriales bacterium]
MKKILIIITGLVLLSACSRYQKVYNGKDLEAKYKMAWELYEAGKYKKADQLFSQADKFYKHKPVYQRLLFAHAVSLYNQKYYVSAGEKFRKFTQLYPESSKAEEAAFYIVKAYDQLSPKYSVDQSYTIRAMEEVNQFLKKYPYSKYKDEVNAINTKLQHKLERKYFEIDKMYYDLDRYKAAIRALNNYLIEYPGSHLKEDALFYRFKAAADLALNSVESKKKERLETAMTYYKNFIQKSKNEPLKKEAEKVYQELEKASKQMDEQNKPLVSTK